LLSLVFVVQQIITIVTFIINIIRNDSRTTLDQLLYPENIHSLSCCYFASAIITADGDDDNNDYRIDIDIDDDERFSASKSSIRRDGQSSSSSSRVHVVVADHRTLQVCFSWMNSFQQTMVMVMTMTTVTTENLLLCLSTD
jgi:hypothetical protein